MLTGDLQMLRGAVEWYRRTPRRLALAAALEDAADGGGPAWSGSAVWGGGTHRRGEVG
ncbi:hypothetical protein GCM10022255_093400 [Dactylosporangium darangshiense]|uniref:Uncharacterized protein n=1 Tax=Dactylosporangium darangshiense TaxID=579108 RepID=A0ABP8DPT6_9ACTN